MAGWSLDTDQGTIRLADLVPSVAAEERTDSSIVRILAGGERVAVALTYTAFPARRELRIALEVDYLQSCELTRGGLDVEFDPALVLYRGPHAIVCRDAARNQQQTLYTQRAILAVDQARGRAFCVHGLHHGALGVELLSEDGFLFYDGEAHCTVLRRPTYEEVGEHRSTRREAGAHDVMKVLLALDPDRPTAWINTFPGACPAAFTLVDDADGERRELLLAAYYGASDTASAGFRRGGLLGHGLETTRTIFANSRLYDVWDRLQADGVEIALHTPTGQADSAGLTAECLAELVPRYRIRQWVDHAVSGNPEDLNFRGSYPPDDNPFYVLDLLEEYHFDYAWVEGNMFRGFDAFRDRRELPHHLDAVDDPGVPGQLLVYGRGGGVFFENYWSCMRDVVTPPALEELTLTAGLAVLYTHMCLVRYHGADVGYLEQDGDTWVVKPEAEELLSLLEQRKDAGELWVAPAATIFDRLRAIDSLVLTDLGDLPDGRAAMRLSNRGALPLEDLGVYLQNCTSISIGGRPVTPTDGGWITVPRLDAGAEILIEARPLFPAGAVGRIVALPNPCRGASGLYFELSPDEADGTELEVQIQDCLGRVLWGGSPHEVGPGRFRVEWDGRDARGRPVPSGRYWAHLLPTTRSRIAAIMLVR